MVKIGGVAAQVQYAGLAPGYEGLYQINLVAPYDLTGDESFSVETASAIAFFTLKGTK